MSHPDKTDNVGASNTNDRNLHHLCRCAVFIPQCEADGGSGGSGVGVGGE